MDFKFDNNADFFRGSIVKENGTSLHSLTYVCYAGSFFKPILTALKTPEAKWYEIYWSDALSFVEKNRKKTQKILELLSTTGIFRYTEIELIELKDVPDFFIEDDYTPFPENVPYWIRLRHDIDKCSGEEMFLVGSIIRTFSLYPDVLLRFLRLYKMYSKKYSVTHLFLIAHSLTWEKKGFYLGGHRIVENSFSILTGKTFNDFLEDLDNDHTAFPPIRKSTHYNNKKIDSYFVTRLVTEGKYGRLGNTMSRWQGTTFSRNIIKTYFDEDLFKKVYYKNPKRISLNN